MKRFAGIAVAALTLAALSAAPASAHLGGSTLLDIDENRAQVKVDGPGFKVRLTKHDLETRIDDERFGFPEAGFPVVRAQPPGPSPLARPYVCENGMYRAAPDGRGFFTQVSRASSTELRPAPYTPQFNSVFRNVFTFVGTLDATVVNEQGERFRLMMSDLAHEVMGSRRFISSNPIHAYFVDSKGRIRDRASLVGRVLIDRETGRSIHYVVDRGTCHQHANLGLGAGTDNAVVFGPFFVLPFNTTVIRSRW